MSVQEADAPILSSPLAPPRRLPKVATASAVLRDLFIVTWAVSPEKAQALIPAGVVLERLPNEQGELVAFAQLVVALRDDARWSPLPQQLGDDFHEATLQVLTRSGTERSAFVVKHFVDSTPVSTSLAAFTRTVEEARFNIYLAGDPARQTFERLGAKLTTHAVQVHIRAELAPTPERTAIGPWLETVHFLTRLECQLHAPRLSKEGLSFFRSQHPPLTPYAAKLTHQIVRPLESLELGEPLVAFYQAELPITNLPIRRT